jgi:hypothetical protein
MYSNTISGTRSQHTQYTPKRTLGALSLPTGFKIRWIFLLWQSDICPHSTSWPNTKVWQSLVLPLFLFTLSFLVCPSRHNVYYEAFAQDELNECQKTKSHPASFLIRHISDITQRASVQFRLHKTCATKSVSIDIGQYNFYLMLRWNKKNSFPAKRASMYLKRERERERERETSTRQNCDLVAIWTFYMKRLPAWCPFNKTEAPLFSHDALCCISNAAEICARTICGKMT